jgi:hypothetical protein
MSGLYGHEHGARFCVFEESHMLGTPVKAHEDGVWGHLSILAIPYGGPNNGRDLDGEYFTPQTNFALDWFPQEGRPLLYHHGLDSAVKSACVGRQLSSTKEVDGIWVEAQLDKAKKYAESIWDLVGQKALYASSGSISHLVNVKSTGEIVEWPWVELSLTPTPANPLAVVSAVEAVKAIKAVGTDVPEAIAEAVAHEKATKAASKKKSTKGDGQGGGTLSDQDVSSRIESLLKEWSMSQMVSEDPLMDMEEEAEECYWWVQSTYSASSYVIARKSGDYQLYRVDYTVMGNTVSISEPRPVEAITSYVATKANRVLSAATLDHMDAMKGHAQAGMDACKAIMATVDEMKAMAGGMGEGMGDGENESAIKASAVLSAAMKQKMQHATHTATGGENAFKAIKDTATMLIGGYDSTPVASTDDTATKALEDVQAAIDLQLLDAELGMLAFEQALFEAEAAPYAMA